VKHLSAVDVGAVRNGVEMGPSPFTVARQAPRQDNREKNQTVRTVLAHWFWMIHVVTGKKGIMPWILFQQY